MDFPDSYEVPQDNWLDHAQAAEKVADAMVQFDAYVSNIQGACDTGSMKAMLEQAKRLYERASE